MRPRSGRLGHPVDQLCDRIVDLTRRPGGCARLLDVIDDRSASALVTWMADRDRSWRAGIGVAALDPYRGYACALRTSLPHAVRVLDAFQVVTLLCAVKWHWSSSSVVTGFRDGSPGALGRWGSLLW